MKLWLDDWRPMPAGYDMHCLTAHEAIAHLNRGRVDEISLDYDLGNDVLFGTGYDVVHWMCQAAGAGLLPRLKWHLHSDSFGGRLRMLKALELLEREWLEQEMQDRDTKL